MTDIPTLRYNEGTIDALDQTALPAKMVVRRITTTAQLTEAIAKLRIRGAPMLGIAGAWGVAQAARRAAGRTGSTRAAVLAAAERAGARLIATRPTAVNLAWAVGRSLDRARLEAQAGAPPATLVKALEQEAAAIAAEDAAACMSMAKTGQRFVRKGARILTHCNTGSLCTGGYGTALGVIRLAHESGKNVEVLAGETRPLLQGARLTAWELGRLGVPHAIVADGAGPSLIARGTVDVVLVGADRIAANGDVANKIGTYPLALAATESQVPFIVVAPISTIDPFTPCGKAIEVEERDPREITGVLGRRIAPAGSDARNPAFDITPARLVTAIVTERGVAIRPYRTSLKRLLSR
ncbi:MAG TPA: S-methyl-5-thioribose-1-phosphate isomerase [Actinomycetota bacterium]